MFDVKIPESLDKAVENATHKPSKTLGELFDAVLSYVTRNIILKYRINRADDDFKLEAHKQEQIHELKLSEIRNQKIEQY